MFLILLNLSGLCTCKLKLAVDFFKVLVVITFLVGRFGRGERIGTVGYARDKLDVWASKFSSKVTFNYFVKDIIIVIIYYM